MVFITLMTTTCTSLKKRFIRNFNLINLESMNESTSKYYITLAELKTEVKIDTLSTFECAEKKMRALQNDSPVLTKYLKGLLEISKYISSTRKWVQTMKETHQAISEYLNTHRQLSKGIHVLPAERLVF